MVRDWTPKLEASSSWEKYLSAVWSVAIVGFCSGEPGMANMSAFSPAVKGEVVRVMNAGGHVASAIATLLRLPEPRSASYLIEQLRPPAHPHSELRPAISVVRRPLPQRAFEAAVIFRLPQLHASSRAPMAFPKRRACGSRTLPLCRSSSDRRMSAACPSLFPERGSEHVEFPECDSQVAMHQIKALRGPVDFQAQSLRVRPRFDGYFQRLATFLIDIPIFVDAFDGIRGPVYPLRLLEEQVASSSPWPFLNSDRTAYS